MAPKFVPGQPKKQPKPIKFAKFKRQIIHSVQRELEPIVEDVQQRVETWKQAYEWLLDLDSFYFV